MGKVVAEFAMSLDGFIADANDGVQDLYRWLMSPNGDTPITLDGREFKTSSVSAAHYRDLLDSVGALVTGRRDFDVSRAWGGRSPFGVPTFIVTHTIPQAWAKPDAPFTFVPEGVEHAVELGKQAAGEKILLISGSKIAQQGIKAGLVDEIRIDLVPILLGTGIRLFDNVGSESIELDCFSAIQAPGVTHLKFRIVKSSH
jgi:dihydrofolate reductase